MDPGLSHSFSWSPLLSTLLLSFHLLSFPSSLLSSITPLSSPLLSSPTDPLSSALLNTGVVLLESAMHVNTPYLWHGAQLVAKSVHMPSVTRGLLFIWWLLLPHLFFPLKYWSTQKSIAKRRSIAYREAAAQWAVDCVSSDRATEWVCFKIHEVRCNVSQASETDMLLFLQ